MVRFVGWLLFFGLLGHAGSVAAQTVTYSFGGVDYPTQAQAESAMRAAHWPAGADLYPCGATQDSPADTRLSYCTPTRIVLHWHDQYTASSPYTITCGHSNDRNVFGGNTWDKYMGWSGGMIYDWCPQPSCYGWIDHERLNH